MKKKLVVQLCMITLSCLLAACGATTEESTDSVAVSSEVQAKSETAATSEQAQPSESKEEASEESSQEMPVCDLEDGQYLATFDTDSSMFHVNEAMEGLGVLTVENGTMTIHIKMPSKNILNLYYGLAEDAAKEDAEILQPILDSVTYSDGITEEVYGFDVPVPYLDSEFDVALIGKKGVWYDHKVSVTMQSRIEEHPGNIQTVALEDGEYSVAVGFAGGTGKAYVESPAVLTVQNGEMFAKLVWSSKNYDYMLVDDVKYLNEAKEGDPSEFTVPVSALGQEIKMIGDTVAMGNPHEIEYTLTFELEE